MNTLVKTDEFSAFEKVATQESGGRIAKFTKDGHWIAGQEEEPLDGAKMLADMAGLSVGWRKWVAGVIVAADLGYVSSGFRPKDRGELDDFEEAAWPTDSRGDRTEPWQFAYFLRLSDEDGQVFAWTAGSNGARRAIGDLCAAYSRRKRNPIVTLEASFYKHKTFGRINTPRLNIVGWAEDAPALPAPASPSEAAPPTAVDYDPDALGHAIDDDIPF